MNRPKAVRVITPSPIAMPIMALVERAVSWLLLELELELVELFGTVMLTAESEKMLPEMLKTWPAAGSCWQPLSRAKMTELC